MTRTRDMKRTAWTRILKRDYVWEPCAYQGLEGIASLLLIREITQPMTVRNGDREITIVDEGMSWLQLAMRDQYIWVTAMFDQQDKLLQIYFDITDGNCLDTADNPTFQDMYLDIVMEPEGRLYLLDQDELDAALNAGDITAEQYSRTRAVAERLYEWLFINGMHFAEFCCIQMKKLKEIYLKENHISVDR